MAGGGGGGNVFASRAVLARATPRLLFYCTVYAMGSVFFGYDSSSFGGVQAMAPFIKQFGSYNPNPEKGEGAYVLAPSTAALMNSLPLLGKLLGAVFVGPIVEKLGHRWTMGGACITQIAGAVIQTTSLHPAQFIVGRFLVFAAFGLAENVVPTYQSEIAPGSLRGFLVGSIQLCLTLGALIAGIVNQFMSSRTNNSGWQIATALQAAPAVLILSCLYWTPLSPRWLAFNDRDDEALKVLRSVRRQEDVDNGVPELEISAMKADWAHVDGGQVDGGRRRQKGAWKHLFNARNRRRTGIACTIMVLHQLTGLTFSSSYGPTFYKQVGLGDKAFIYAVVNNAVSVVTALLAMVLLDVFGRRSLVFHGGYSQGAFLFAVAALGSKTAPNVNQSRGVVAGMILYSAILHMTIGPGAYITAAEVGTQDLREKTMAFATAIDVIAGFVVVFVTPYILADIGAGLAYIWGGFAFLVSVWTWFCMPELKGRTLEEIDELFDAKIPARKFSGYETTGQAKMVHQVEDGTVQPKAVNQHQQQVDEVNPAVNDESTAEDSNSRVTLV